MLFLFSSSLNITWDHIFSVLDRDLIVGVVLVHMFVHDFPIGQSWVETDAGSGHFGTTIYNLQVEKKEESEQI